MDWKILVAAIIAIAIFGYYADESYTYIKGDPSEIKLDISSAVEELGAKEGVNVSLKGYMHKNDGWFSSSGKIIIGSDNASDYISTVKNESLTDVYFVFVERSTILTKKYWAFSGDNIFEYKETYGNKIDRRTAYTLQDYNNTAVVFEKNYTWTAIILIVVIGFYGLFPACVAYIILRAAEMAYMYIIDR